MLNQKLKRVTLIFIALSVHAFANATAPLERKQTVSVLTGSWSPNCGKMSVLRAEPNGKATMEINSNQIVIRVSQRSSNDGTIELFFHETVDLGRGGMLLNWNDFAIDRKVADFHLINENTAKFRWFGFHDRKKRQYIWRTEPDYLQEWNPGIFKRCN